MVVAYNFITFEISIVSNSIYNEAKVKPEIYPILFKKTLGIKY